MMLDVSRHFERVDFIKKYLDGLAMMKMNVFHWHLVDDGGWRVEIKRYPRLTQVGAWRYGITTGWDQSKLRFDPESGLAQVRRLLHPRSDSGRGQIRRRPKHHHRARNRNAGP